MRSCRCRRRRELTFANSGTEAVETALKLAMHATGREKFIAFFNSFHGRTLGSLSLTSSQGLPNAWVSNARRSTWFTFPIRMSFAIHFNADRLRRRRCRRRAH